LSFPANGNPEKNLISPYSTLVEKKSKTSTTLLPYLFTIKRKENKIYNKVIMYALIHLLSTKVYKKNNVLDKSVISALRGNDRWQNKLERLFFRMKIFALFFLSSTT
jgi:hypothetical protein